MKLRIVIITVLIVVLCSCGTEGPPPSVTMLPGGPTATATVPVVEAQPTVVPATETPEIILGKVIARSLFVRNGPGTTFPVVGGLVEGDEVEVVGKNADGAWLQIVYEDGRAWVSAEWVNLGE